MELYKPGVVDSDVSTARYVQLCMLAARYATEDRCISTVALWRTMSDESTVSYCFECKQPLVEIDNYGKRLTGCLTCNIWWSLNGTDKVRLPEEDLRALRLLRRG